MMKLRSRSIQQRITVPPERLEDHHPSRYTQDPLKKQDRFNLIKTQVRRGDDGENREDG